jgi:hypothetical protein
LFWTVRSCVRIRFVAFDLFCCRSWLSTKIIKNANDYSNE